MPAYVQTPTNPDQAIAWLVDHYSGPGALGFVSALARGQGRPVGRLVKQGSGALARAVLLVDTGPVIRDRWRGADIEGIHTIRDIRHADGKSGRALRLGRERGPAPRDPRNDPPDRLLWHYAGREPALRAYVPVSCRADDPTGRRRALIAQAIRDGLDAARDPDETEPWAHLDALTYLLAPPSAA